MKRRTRIGSIILSVMATVLLAAGESAADWQLYFTAGLGISGADVDTDGVVNTTPPVSLSGMDNDSSPLLSGAFGIQIPMDELVPREWLPDFRLPSWPVRFELEAAGLREYEFGTIAAGETLFTELTTTTVFLNSSVDIPLVSLYKPVQYMFGVGRQPRVRRWLEPASFYILTGIGIGLSDFDGTSNVIDVEDDILDFAWNAGAGVNYALTERVTVGAGYRYVGLGDQTIDAISNTPSTGGDEIDFEPNVHELRIDFRILFFDFRSPWR